MSVFKSQFTRALTVLPSNDANIPFPSPIVSSITTGGATNQLIDSAVDFITLNVQAGDIVYNTSANQAATVVGVIDANTLELNADIMGLGDNYVIYQASAQTGLGNTGCYLLPTDNSNLTVTTIGGDYVTIFCYGGVFLPLQVLKLHSVGSGTVTALW
jgi:hypothetical protein